MIIITTSKPRTREALKRHISQHRPCTYFTIQSKDEGINNGYQDVAEQYPDEFFRDNNLIIIKPEI